jgi:hypothetical protein
MLTIYEQTISSLNPTINQNQKKIKNKQNLIKIIHFINPASSHQLFNSIKYKAYNKESL